MAILIKNDDLISQINITSRQLTGLLDEQLAPLQLTSSNYYFLLKLADNEPLTQDELYQRIYLSPSNVTRRLDQLIKLGFVEKTRSTTDKRAWVLHLTPTGQALVTKLQAQIGQINQQLFAELSSADQATLATLLAKVSSNLSTK